MLGSFEGGRVAAFRDYLASFWAEYFETVLVAARSRGACVVGRSSDEGLCHLPGPGSGSGTFIEANPGRKMKFKTSEYKRI